MRYPVGPGWWPLLDEMVEKLRALDPEVELMFKEKHGTCQINYCTESSEHFNAIRKLTDEAENASKTICEICGQPGYLRNDHGWMQTLCDSCAGLTLPERYVLVEKMVKELD